MLTATVNRNHLSGGTNHWDSGRGKSAAQRNVIRMLGEQKYYKDIINGDIIDMVLQIVYYRYGVIITPYNFLYS